VRNDGYVADLVHGTILSNCRATAPVAMGFSRRCACPTIEEREIWS